MQETDQTQILYTDAEARVMRTKDGGRRACYNVQAAVDAESHMFLGYDVSNDRNDLNKLCSTAKIAMENTGKRFVEAVTDKGYSSAKDVEECLMNGIAPQVGIVVNCEERVINLEYRPQEITEEKRDSQEPEDIQACLHAGVLPKCYENTDISIQLQYESEMSCFIRHEDGRVTCPMGKEMNFIGEKKTGTVYGTISACRSCANRCTSGKTYKRVKFGRETKYVPVRMYGRPKYPLQQIPGESQPEHKHVKGKAKRARAQVMVYIKRNVEKLKERLRVSEHPFGTVKFYDGAHYFLCKGKEMVSAEVSLMFTSYNIRRAITLAGGVQKLMRRMMEAVQRMKEQGRSLPI